MDLLATYKHLLTAFSSTERSYLAHSLDFLQQHGKLNLDLENTHVVVGDGCCAGTFTLYMVCEDEILIHGTECAYEDVNRGFVEAVAGMMADVLKMGKV